MIPIWAYAAIGLAIFAAGAASGAKVDSWRADAKELRAVNAAMAEVQKGADQERAAAVAAVQQQEKIRVVYRTVTKQITKWRDLPAARAVCLDSSGLVLANDALRGPSQAGPEPVGPVSPTGSGPVERVGGRTPG